MALTIYKILISVVMITAIILILGPAFYYFDSPTVARSLNLTAYNSSVTLNNRIYSPINSTILPKNQTSGAFANPLISSAFALVLNNVAYVFLSVLKLPLIAIYVISTPLSLFGFATAQAQALSALLFELMGIVILFVVASYFGKYDLRRG